MRVATCRTSISDEGLLCYRFFLFSLSSYFLEVAELSDLNGEVKLMQQENGVSVCCSVLQCVALRCSVLQHSQWI